MIERAYAQCPAGWENLCKIGPDSNPNFVGNIVNILLVIAIIMSLIFLVYGGIRWAMSGGDKAKLDQARSTLIGALIGLVISLLGYAIVYFIVYVISGVHINSLQIIRLTN